MKNYNKTANPLINYLNEKKIAEIEELKIFLRTSSRMTIFRKLKGIEYISSYSHSGRYYSLERIAKYNEYGIWEHKLVLFSRKGTLKKTIADLILNSSEGYSAHELKTILKIKVEDALLALVKTNKISRKKLFGTYVYFSRLPKLGKKQELCRNNQIQCLSDKKLKPELLMNELKAALIIFFSTLDEKQRRLYAGYESLRIGHGGDKEIAEILDLNKKTVAKGRKELLSGKSEIDSIRESGGGRKEIQKKNPGGAKKN